jgi:hypothetical protein
MHHHKSAVLAEWPMCHADPLNPAHLLAQAMMLHLPPSFRTDKGKAVADALWAERRFLVDELGYKPEQHSLPSIHPEMNDGTPKSMVVGHFQTLMAALKHLRSLRTDGITLVSAVWGLLKVMMGEDAWKQGILVNAIPFAAGPDADKPVGKLLRHLSAEQAKEMHGLRRVVIVELHKLYGIGKLASFGAPARKWLQVQGVAAAMGLGGDAVCTECVHLSIFTRVQQFRRLRYYAPLTCLSRFLGGPTMPDIGGQLLAKQDSPAYQLALRAQQEGCVLGGEHWGTKATGKPNAAAAMKGEAGLTRQ